MAVERLDKILASQGFGSRKDVHIKIRRGEVQVDGRPAKAAEEKVDPERQLIEVNGQCLRFRRYRYLMMNKPGGVVSASRDPKARTVVDLVPPSLARRGLFPAGRLDKDTTGLLILTDDGEFAHRMLAPKSKVVKRYEAIVSAQVTSEDVAAFAGGIVLADGTVCREAGLLVLADGPNPKVEVRIHEGKFHQVKRMFMAVGKEVLALKRTKIGGLSLDLTLSEGECREMSENEISLIFLGKNE